MYTKTQSSFFITTSVLTQSAAEKPLLAKKKQLEKNQAIRVFPIKPGLVTAASGETRTWRLRTLADPRCQCVGLTSVQIKCSETATLLVLSGPHFCLVGLFGTQPGCINYGELCVAVFVTGAEVKCANKIVTPTFHYAVKKPKGISLPSAAGWNGIRFTVSVRTWTIWGTLIYLHLNKGVCVK